MGIGTGAAEALARMQRDGGSSAAAESVRGTFVGWQVGAPAKQPHWKPRQETPKAATMGGAAAERTSLRSRLATAPDIPSNEPGPIGERVSGSGAETAHGMANGARSPPDSRRPGSFWLTPERNAALEEQDRRLKELEQRLPPAAPGTRGELHALVAQVQFAERETTKAHELMEKSRTEALSDAEWRRLWFILRSHRPHMATRGAKLLTRLSALSRRDALNPPDAGLVNELERRFSDAQEYWHRVGLSWLGAARRIYTTLPLNFRQRVSVESYVVPGRVLGVHFPTGYHVDERKAAPRMAIFPHVPDLALTGLSNARNETLFLGVRHGIVHADECNGEFLRQLDRDELKATLFAIREGQAGLGNVDASRDELLVEGSRQIRSSPQEAALLAELLQLDICGHMYVETLSAALVANPEVYQRADQGKAVELQLFSIALLTPADVGNWFTQHYYFDVCRRIGMPSLLEVRDPFVPQRKISAATRIRQFALPAEGRLHQRVHKVNEDSATLLLGPLDSPKLRGDIGSRISAMNQEHRQLTDSLSRARETHAQVSESWGEGDSSAFAARLMIDGIARETARLGKSARTLQQAGLQLKALWRRQGDWPAGEAAQETAALLALAGHIMNEMPLMSCARGRGFTERLDAEVKLLATTADANDGQLPMVDTDMAGWRTARSDFVLPK